MDIEDVGPRQRKRRIRRQGGYAPELHERDQFVADSRPQPGMRGKGENKRSGLVTVHLGERWSQIVREIKRGDYTWKQFAQGLTAEELARAQLRDSNGTFIGRPPTLVPREFHLECFRELKRRFDEEFQKGVLSIAEQYVALAKNEDIPVRQRAKMMQYAMERVFGSIPKEVLVKQDAPWESVVTTVVSEEDEEAPTWRKNRYAKPEEEDEGSDEPE